MALRLRQPFLAKLNFFVVSGCCCFWNRKKKLLMTGLNIPCYRGLCDHKYIGCFQLASNGFPDIEVNCF